VCLAVVDELVLDHVPDLARDDVVLLGEDPGEDIVSMRSHAGSLMGRALETTWSMSS
jgi:hypothetical protein